MPSLVAAWLALPRQWKICVIECELNKHGVDATSAEFLGLIEKGLADGLIDAVHVGTPCSSSSRARERPNGPPPPRGNEWPWGLPDLRAADDLPRHSEASTRGHREPKTSTLILVPTESGG